MTDPRSGRSTDHDSDIAEYLGRRLSVTCHLFFFE